ncbi:MAG: hypothetical protein ACRD12_15460, partial [Acidimicrobiales bacterium]
RRGGDLPLPDHVRSAGQARGWRARLEGRRGHRERRWIGKGAKIVSSVTVGNGTVMGAFAVVSRNVRPYAVVVGNPGVEVKRRLTDEQIDALEAIARWDWPIERVLEAGPLLSSSNVDGFIAKGKALARA